MRVISVINYKGGVGKTTLTANLGAELACRGMRVLLIDVDPQASLTFSFLSPEEWERDFAATRTIRAWIEAATKPNRLKLDQLIHAPPRVNETPHLRQSGGHLALICSHLALLNVDLELATGLAGGTLDQVQRNFLRIHRLLAGGLAELPPDSFDLVLIDCPPNFNIVTRAAIVASGWLLVPARPDYLSTLGIQYLSREVRALVANFNDFAAALADGTAPIDPKFLGVVFTMVREYRQAPVEAQQAFISRVERLNAPVFASYVKDNVTVFADAPEHGVPVVLRRYGAVGRDAVVVGLEAVADEFLRKLGMDT